MTETNKIFDALAELSDMFEKNREQYDVECNQFWDDLSEEDKLKAFYSVCKRIHKGDVEDRRSYRGVLYNVFGFGFESYTIGMDGGYMSIHNLIIAGIDAKETVKEPANPMKEDYTKSGDQV